jgi:hypothetical protein
MPNWLASATASATSWCFRQTPRQPVAASSTTTRPARAGHAPLAVEQLAPNRLSATMNVSESDRRQGSRLQRRHVGHQRNQSAGVHGESFRVSSVKPRRPARQQTPPTFSESLADASLLAHTYNEFFTLQGHTHGQPITQIATAPETTAPRGLGTTPASAKTACACIAMGDVDD